MTVKPVTYYEVHCDEPGCTSEIFVAVRPA